MARGNRPLTRGRLCAIAFLVSLYLFGIALLASLSLDTTNRRGFGHPPSSNNHHSNSNSRPLQDAGLGTLGLIRSQGIPVRLSPGAARLRWCRPLNFLQPSGPPVALASFPGSGNTWLRYLIQQATGIHTGSVYKDIGLLKSGFPAESIANGSVLVVKTHEWGPEARAAFHAAVLLVRTPREAIHAEFNRQGGGHVGYAAPSIYRRMGGVYWTHFVEDKARVWRQTNLDWIYNFTGPHHIIFYENLVQNLEPELRGVLRFLNVPVSEEQLKCALQRSEGIFRRKKRPSPFNPFSEAQIQMLDQLKQEVYKEIESYNRNQIKSDYDTDRVQRT